MQSHHIRFDLGRLNTVIFLSIASNGLVLTIRCASVIGDYGSFGRVFRLFLEIKNILIHLLVTIAKGSELHFT
jgi:hypothetical protein